MGFGSRVLTAGGLGVTTAFVVACGSSSGGGQGLLSQGQSATISAELATISDAVTARDCGKARAGIGELNSTLAALPGSVNQRLVHNLGQGAVTTRSLALRECRRAHPSSSTSTTTSSSTSSTPTTESTPITQSQSETVTQTQTHTETQSTTTGQVGTGGVTSLTSATTNGGAGLGGGG
jgi:hypothetical protein